MTVPGKRCRRCNHVKDRREFNVCSRNFDGLYSYCRTCVSLAKRKAYKDNPLPYKESCKKHYEKNSARYRAKFLDYWQRNPEKRRINWTAYRARKNNAPVVEAVDRVEVFIRDGGICYMCHRKIELCDMHMDHFIPLSKGGEHSWVNCKTACASCNKHKSAKMPDRNKE